jgi:predicted acylesterase/phospholipase RssA
MNKELLNQMKAVGDQCVTEVKQAVGTTKQYSDVIIKNEDGSELQFVNLVQEGGGVWGIALVGYTYVLEKMGIRFLKLAGTSAGAINTMVMAAIGERQEEKSDKILQYLVGKDFSSFIDGHPIAKSFIKWFIFQKNAQKKVLNSLLYLVLSSIGFMFLGSILMWGRPNGILSLEIWLVITAFLFWFGYDLYLRFSREKSIKDKPKTIDNKKDVNKRIIGFIGLLMVALFVLYLISWYSNQCNNFQNIVEIFMLGAFLIFSIWSCFQKDHFALSVQGLGTFITIIVFIITLMHINGFYPIEQLLNSPTKTKPLSASPYLHISSLGISLFIMLVGYFGGLAFFLYKRFADRKFGINPGIEFRNWIDDIAKENNTPTLKDLADKFNNSNLPLQHRDRTINIDDLKKYEDNGEPSVCLITSEIYTNTKVEFPKMASMFWKNSDEVPLADFVRASMSIPIFFEAFRRSPEEIPVSDAARNERKKYMVVGELNDENLDTIEKSKGFAFMDGGIISNFPINKFFKPVEKARMPTFGVMLSEEYKSPSDSLSGIVGSILSTSRGHYDRSFLAEHEFYKQCLTNIQIKDINWLNFELEDKEKKQLFEAGAVAAKQFLINFDWKTYKSERNAWVKNNFSINNPTNP